LTIVVIELSGCLSENPIPRPVNRFLLWENQQSWYCLESPGDARVAQRAKRGKMEQEKSFFGLAGHCNVLKTLNSDKEIQGNRLVFSWPGFGFRFAGFVGRASGFELSAYLEPGADARGAMFGNC
jgi:hypothetical protein